MLDALYCLIDKNYHIEYFMLYTLCLYECNILYGMCSILFIIPYIYIPCSSCYIFQVISFISIIITLCNYQTAVRFISSDICARKLESLCHLSRLLILISPDICRESGRPRGITLSWVGRSWGQAGLAGHLATPTYTRQDTWGHAVYTSYVAPLHLHRGRRRKKRRNTRRTNTDAQD